MALITRLSRLFQADVHAVLDRVEEPIVLLRHAVREMEEDLAQDNRQLNLLTVEVRQVEKREVDISRSLQKIQSELDVCFRFEKDDLAKTLIKRKLTSQQLKDALRCKLEQLQQNVSSLQSRVTENSSRMEAMRQKAELLSEEKTEGCWDDYMVCDSEVKDEDVEVAFLQEKQQRAAS